MSTGVIFLYLASDEEHLLPCTCLVRTVLKGCSFLFFIFICCHFWSRNVWVSWRVQINTLSPRAIGSVHTSGTTPIRVTQDPMWWKTTSPSSTASGLAWAPSCSKVPCTCASCANSIHFTRNITNKAGNLTTRWRDCFPPFACQHLPILDFSDRRRKYSHPACQWGGNEACQTSVTHTGRLEG